jgi:hypothetical protein
MIRRPVSLRPKALPALRIGLLVSRRVPHPWAVSSRQGLDSRLFHRTVPLRGCNPCTLARSPPYSVRPSLGAESWSRASLHRKPRPILHAGWQKTS